MRLKSEFEFLGFITSKQSNNLSVFETGKGTNKTKLKIAGGDIGDAVVKINKEITTIKKDEWLNMPANQIEANEIEIALDPKLAELSKKVKELEAKIAKNQDIESKIVKQDKED